MMEGYHYQNRVHGFNQLVRPVYEPSPTLAVAGDEFLAPTHKQEAFYELHRKEPTVLPFHKQMMENVNFKLDGSRVNDEDFPRDGYFGNPIEGWNVTYGGI
ncbi:hypothetical protein MWG61_13285 [Bacillus safensis]|uniref:hypothetical protein n=1 Tax=Bacillus safensis TaxID=561879 RepID=UPI002282CEFD|nr:hypothetical protein [Bacillus safensis]MCY7525113.1 hypothetical protein [Bacillus safensis]